MRLSEIGDKEIVDMSDGRRYGQLWDAEMLFNMEDGHVESLLIPDHDNKVHFLSKNKEYMQLPWSCILKIGDEIIIIDSKNKL